LLVNTLTEAEVPQPHFDQFEDPPSIAPFSVPPPSVPPPSVPQIEAPVSTVEGVGSLYPLFSSPDPKGHVRYCHHLSSVR